MYLQLLISPLEELNFLGMLLFFHLALFLCSFIHLVTLCLQFIYLTLELHLVCLQLFNLNHMHSVSQLSTVAQLLFHW